MSNTKQVFPNGIVVERANGFFTITFNTIDQCKQFSNNLKSKLDCETLNKLDYDTFQWTVKITEKNCKLLSAWVKTQPQLSSSQSSLPSHSSSLPSHSQSSLPSHSQSSLPSQSQSSSLPSSQSQSSSLPSQLPSTPQPTPQLNQQSQLPLPLPKNLPSRASRTPYESRLRDKKFTKQNDLFGGGDDDEFSVVSDFPRALRDRDRERYVERPYDFDDSLSVSPSEMYNPNSYEKSEYGSENLETKITTMEKEIRMLKEYIRNQNKK